MSFGLVCPILILECTYKVNADKKFNVEIDEIDACPVQIQGPKSKALLNDLIGDQVDLDNMPYGLAEAKVEVEAV